MIIYKQRPDTIPVRIDTVAKTVTNVVNKPDQKILGFMTSEDYYTKFTADAENWPSITEEEFELAKAAVVEVISAI
jgi:hypothetical protein